MLPATGLFRTISCPFYEKDLCTRPFCHFKHAKSEPPAATYSATPKSLLNAPGGATEQTEGSDVIVRKKPKLEYIPVSTVAPRYVPTSVAKLQATKSNGEKTAENNSSESSEATVTETTKESQEIDTPKATKPSEDTNLPSKTTEESSSLDNNTQNGKEPEAEVENVPTETSTHHHSSKNHKPSTSDSDRKKDGSHSRHHGSSSRKSSSSTSHDKKHRSSESSSKDKSSSSSSKKTEDKRKRPLEEEIYQELVNNPPSDIDIDSDEDDVLQQCKMIFEEYQPDTPKIVETEGSSNGQVDLIDIFADKYYDDNRKKRVAYESATTSKLGPPPEKKTNHIQNAIRSVYLRQEIVRKQQEELAARKQAEEEAKRQIQEETQKAMKKLATPPPPANGAPIASPINRFTPAVNVLAFQKAKEKIEQLKKNQASFTPAQTAPKTGSRVAHAASAIAAKAAATPSAQAPPILEPASSKISYHVRMQYYGLMVNHCMSIYPSAEDAWDRAQKEELAVMKKCSTAMIYKSSALLTINKLRKEALDAGIETVDKKTEVKTSAYTIDNAPATVAYKMIYECKLTEELLRSNGFPRPTDVPGKAKIFTTKPSRPPNEDERYCSRCSKVYNVELYDEPQVDACNYHPKSTCYRRGFADNLHNCCQQPSGTPGCMYANYHVSSYLDYENLTGFVKTIDPPEDYQPSKKDVFALDCEMCYTTGGLELTRVTVVDINEKTVYDTLVKPLNRIVDYNTRFSGITEEMLRNTTTTLYNVQAVLLSMFNSESILIGHSLESDFRALKLIHDVVVDTSVLYPHKMGPPKKRALKTLCIENLKKIIQENDAGHDSAEDSVVCIQLIKHYLRNRIL
uniref:Uncharacterized protein n=1 Tax=Anopheles atroparvus TaxID=41427 RepID=A0A182IN61_ANOAO